MVIKKIESESSESLLDNLNKNELYVLLLTIASLASIPSVRAFKDYTKCIHPGDFALNF
ncbi:hypothetical protein H8356DRAFT_1355660 [Neocallimastix lanati (nom. inval.)]|nr:hypothetical protein H8356DRAFT_1355660 [Neocallimastix sp. JGI-2020a]